MKTIFKNAMVASSRNQKRADVFVDGGKIVAPFPEKGAKIIDATGKILMPGVIDPHVHFRSPGAEYKEDWETGSKAAAHGGVTTVLDMPNTDPPTTTVKALEQKRKMAEKQSMVKFGFFAGTDSANVGELKKMQDVVGIKVYMGSSTGGLLVEETSALEEIFRVAKAKDIPVVVHAESEARIQSRRKEYEGSEDPVDYARLRDPECARQALELALKLRRKIGNRLHIAHVSTKGELDLLREMKDPKVTCEVAPHHLFFTMEDMEDAHLKMNPPLRTIVDVEALWRGLLDGTVTCIATDHAPHSLEEKNQDMWTAPAGVPGVQFSLPLMLNAVDEERLSLERVIALMCEGPARAFGLSTRGFVKEGMDADLVLVDLELQKTITNKEVLSKCGWTPYEFFTLKGWPVLTMVGGEVVMDCFEA